MSQTIKLNIKQIFDLAFDSQNKKQFKLARKLYEKILEIDPNIKNALFNLGTVYEELGEDKQAIKCYERVINIDPTFIHSYNNLGLIFQKFGENEKAINYFKKTIEINPTYVKAYNNLGMIYSELGKYKEAIDNYIISLKHDKENKIAVSNLISALTHFLPNISHPIVNANKDLKKISNNMNIEDLLQKKNLINYFQQVYKVKNKIKNNIKFLDFSESQAFRKNSFDLNCERHHKVFNKVNLIPKFCFSCFKIQIEPINVLHLIKLFLIFDNLKLKNNNWRKCMIELRSNITGIYKGLIYCSSLDEAENILINITPILDKNIKYKLNIKRGCTEFYTPFPNYKIINKKHDNYMEHPLKWEKLEPKEHHKENSKPQKLVSSVSGLSISDVLIINQWLNYANLIDDKSYNEIGLEFTFSEYIHKKMSHQTKFRKKQFLC